MTSLLTWGVNSPIKHHDMGSGMFASLFILKRFMQRKSAESGPLSFLLDFEICPLEGTRAFSSFNIMYGHSECNVGAEMNLSMGSYLAQFVSRFLAALIAPLPSVLHGVSREEQSWPGCLCWFPQFWGMLSACQDKQTGLGDDVCWSSFPKSQLDKERI